MVLLDPATVNALARTLKEKTKWKTIIRKNANRKIKLKKE
jgi:hypothetical protein